MAADISSLPSARVSNTFPESSSSKSHVILHESVQSSRIADVHRLYPAKLLLDEELWRDRYTFLLNHGLELRLRYKPGWTPSWLGTNLDPATCEDSIEKTMYMVLDAKRQDGTKVCIKRIEPKIDLDSELKMAMSNEAKIGRYLSTEQMLRHTTNHCVPILDYFRDPVFPDVEYIVMPVLRPYNDPEFCFIGEVVDFVTQLLEGLNFMHSHLVAHGDVKPQNIMLDGRPIFTKEWHFVRTGCAPNGIDPIVPLARIDHPVRYFIIDYDCSILFRPGQPHLLEGFDGIEGSPPELKKHQQYDAFKVDVFALGDIFNKEFYEVYDGLEFLKPQIDAMITPDFRRRPTAQDALQRWVETKVKLNVSIARWRLRKRDEFVGLRVVRDAVSAMQQSFDNVTRILQPHQQVRVRTWSNP